MVFKAELAALPYSPCITSPKELGDPPANELIMPAPVPAAVTLGPASAAP